MLTHSGTSWGATTVDFCFARNSPPRMQNERRLLQNLRDELTMHTTRKTHSYIHFYAGSRILYVKLSYKMFKCEESLEKMNI